MYYAHSINDNPDEKCWHTLRDHLTRTGSLAAAFAAPFGAENAANLAGLLHDLGKYSAKFQSKLHGVNIRVDHSTAGAKQVLQDATSRYDKVVAGLISYAIAGHHAGLADYACLQERIAKSIEPVDEIWRQEIDINVGSLWPKLKPNPHDTPKQRAFQLAFLGRMLFSCLIDADRKDTVEFYRQHEKLDMEQNWPELRQHIEALITRFDAKMRSKRRNDTPLNVLRGEILHHVRSKASEAQGLFTLTVPTGGGKTLASLGFALDHAKTHNLRRIIYAIPYTSIIEQSAAIFRTVLGEDYILEHHCSFEESENTKGEQRDKLKLAMEDWFAPVVVTTNVQFFESLFADRPSRCRKLRNLANSVIIVDEAQSLPLHLLRPCMAALDVLTKHYGVTVILCTATQPALGQEHFHHGDGLALAGRELAPDPSGLARKLKRVQIVAGQTLDDDALVGALQEQPQALVIVNSRTHAMELYRHAMQAGLDGMVHLTTRQCAADRRKILEQVRQNLHDKKPCRVIATSLIECGVDISFPRVWRAAAGLDQIAQAAGRCNREGENPIQDSIVTIFTAKDHRPPPEIMQLAADFSRVAGKHEDLLSPAAIQDYFQEVYWRKGANELDRENILEEFDISGEKILFNYEAAAHNFRLIETGLVPVIINYTKTVQDILNRLNAAKASPGKAARELQSYIVQIPPKDFNKLRFNGRVKFFRSDLWGNQFAVLEDTTLYKAETGLLWEDADNLQETIF